jgi:hypothetical protein
MWKPRTTSLLTVALAGTILFSPAAAWAQAKVVVLDTLQASLTLKLGVRQAVATALDDLSVGMVPIEDVLPEDATCADAPCYAAMASRLGATHVLVVQGVANPAGYRLSLDVRDGETGRSLGSDGKDCELCAEDQLAPTVQEKVTSLWIRVMQEQAAAAQEREARRTALSPVHARVAEPVEDNPWWQQRTPGIGLGFAGLGLVAVGFGVYYVVVDGKAVERNTLDQAVIVRDTSKWGWSLTGVGAVSLLAGAAMIIWGREDGSEVAVAVGPRSIGLQGRF